MQSKPLKLSKQSQIQEDKHYQVMRILEDNPDFTQRELAEKLGVSVGGLNYCLKALIKKGWIKMKNFNQSKNKFGYVYVLTPQGVSQRVSLTANYLKRKLQEYSALKKEIEQLKLETKPSDTSRLIDK